MVFRANGMFPTEFDPTTNSLLATVQALGTTDEELAEDQEFLCDLLTMVGGYNAPVVAADQMIHVMDMAFIGLVYHRHIPFIDEDTNEKVRLSEASPAGYTITISMLSTALVQQMGVNPEQIMSCASDAAEEAVANLRPPDSLDDDGLRLHTDFIALCILGMIVHRLIPTTTNTPQ